jgi:serine/threonine protein kinase
MPRTQHGNPDQQQQHHSFHAQPLPSRHLQHQLQQHQPPQLHQHLQHHKVPQHHEHQLPHFPQHAPQRLQDLPQTPGIATTHVGNYTLYTKIGEGAFGNVKLGINRDTKELVAVKIMDKKEIREQNLSVQVRCEIYIMRSLLHKHIVRMYELITSDTKLYFVMEFVTGGDLFERLGKGGRVDESLARHCFHQLAAQSASFSSLSDIRMHEGQNRRHHYMRYSDS